VFGQQLIIMGALNDIVSTKPTITFFVRIFDEATSCSRRSEDLLDRITVTAATLESRCKPVLQNSQLTDLFPKVPASDPDSLLQGMGFLHMKSYKVLPYHLELKRYDDSQRHEVQQIVNKKVSQGWFKSTNISYHLFRISTLINASLFCVTLAPLTMKLYTYLKFFPLCLQAFVSRTTFPIYRDCTVCCTHMGRQLLRSCGERNSVSLFL
jgi:hypothetical protein